MSKSYLQPERGIKSWREEERPREKLQLLGAANLTLAELLGILIGSGHAEATAVEVAREILQAVDYDLHALSGWKPTEFEKFKGIGPAKSVTLVAALEVTRRRQQQAFRSKTALTDSEATYRYLRGILGDLEHEEFWILCLNQANLLLAAHHISKGGITGTVVDNRLMFKRAINTPKCVAIILAHNHPSGQLKPSQADVQLTAKIVRAAHDLDFRILDHLIVGQNGYYSFKDNNLI